MIGDGGWQGVMKSDEGWQRMMEDVEVQWRMVKSDGGGGE